MLEPKPNETQPQFAIRFHESMMNEIPDTAKRNRACFDAWDSTVGEDPTISELVESRFTPDQYQRLNNVAMFHEHEIPEQEIEGKKVPAQHYGREELAEMVAGMNDRILDHDEFSPITRGHSGQKPGAKNGDRQMPEVLGFAGPYKLGMIGRKNPRWAIFGNEYHVNQHVPELKKRVGRSPEVWRYARMRDRFFYPIATLGEEVPRLNLPPAHYSRRSQDSTPVFVECYSAVANCYPVDVEIFKDGFGDGIDVDLLPEVDVDNYEMAAAGGNSTCPPSFRPSPDKRKPMADSYSQADNSSSQTPLAAGNSADGSGSNGGSNGDDIKLSDLTLGQFMTIWMETQPMEFLMGLMRQSPQSDANGMPNPAVQNEIPADPNAAAPVAPGMNPQDPQNPMAGGAASPAPAAVPQAPASAPAAPSPPAVNSPVPAAPGGQAPASPPAAPQKPGQFPMVADKDKDTYSRQLQDVMAANADLKKQLGDALAKIAQIDGEKTRIERYSRLEKLGSDFVLNPDVELERTAGYSPEQFEAHVAIITDNYSRTLVNTPDFASLSAGVTVEKSPSGPSKSGSSIVESDLPVIEKYCIEHDVNYADAKEIYLRGNKSFPA